MKKMFSIALMAIALSACQNGTKQADANDVDSVAANSTLADTASAPKVEVEKAIFDFGVIKQGEKVSYEFKFKNVGNSPLIITDASATCGCTVPEYPKTPIKPGEEGRVKVIFDSSGKLGMQDKVITINSNANPAFEQLHFVGEIKENK
jgi:hypothetical protein